MTEAQPIQPELNLDSFSQSDEKTQPVNEAIIDLTGSKESEVQVSPQPLRDPTYSWLNLAIIVLAYIDIFVSFSLGLILVVYYAQSAEAKTPPGAYLEKQLATVKDPQTLALIQALLANSRLQDIEAAYRVKVFYYGVGVSLMATLLTPTAILTLGSRFSSPCSYIWIFRSRPVLWIALFLSIAVSLTTIVTFNYDYSGPKRFLLLLIVPILLLRLLLWICYVLYGMKCDYQDPRNRFWPYSNDHADANDLALWL